MPAPPDPTGAETTWIRSAGASSYVPAAASAPTATDNMLAQMRSDIRQQSGDFKSLKAALRSNNLNGATQAFATLSQDIKTASQATGGKSPFDPGSPIGKDFKAIGDSLKSGDLAAAKEAFTSFKKDIKSAGRATRAQNWRAVNGANDGDMDDWVPNSDTMPTNPTAASPASGSILNATA